MLIGETFTTKDNITYTCIHRNGTLRRLGKLPLTIRLYLEIRNGFLNPLPLEKLGDLVFKYENEKWLNKKIKKEM